MTASLSRRARPGWWQRRYLLEHYGSYEDPALARATGLTVGVVQGYLDSQHAGRTAAERRRIERRGTEDAPTCWTPTRILRRMARLEPRLLTWVDGCLLGALFIASLVLYALTAARTVTGEDAGELLAAAHTLGVPHPPGYPLWTLLAAAFDRVLPWGTVAWRVSLVSAVFAAGANTLLFAIALKTLRSRVAALAGAALFAISLTHWKQSVIPEVYGLNTFLVAAGVLLLICLAERPTTARLLALAAVAGLGCTNHTTALPVAGILAVGAASVHPRLFRRPAVVAGAILCGLAPLLLYAYLPWASGRDPYLDWGNPESLDRLLAHVARTQYTSVEEERQLASTYGDYLRRLGVLSRAFGEQVGSPWVLPLVVIGFYTLSRRQTGPWLVLLSIGWFCSVGVTRYTQYSFDREHVYAAQIFFIPAWMVVSWLLAGGIDTLLFLQRRLKGASWIPSTVVGVAAGCLIVVLAGRNLDRADRSATTLVADYGQALLDIMDEGALYFPASDHSTFAVMYWQGVEDYRTDVVIADKYGRLEQHLLDRFMDDSVEDEIRGQSGPEQRRILERMLIERWPGPVYLANRREMADLPGRRLEPVGPLFGVMTEDQTAAWWSRSEDGRDPPGLVVWERLAHLDLEDPVEGLDITVQMVRADLHSMRGFAQMRAGRIEDALATWDRIEGDLAPLKQVHNNIGSSLAEHGMDERAARFYELALTEDRGYGMALRNAAIVCRNLGETGQAVSLLERLVAVEPDHRDARQELARLLEKQGRLVDALAAYEAMARRDRNDPEPWVAAGLLLERHGDQAKAKDALTEALRLQPTNVQASEALARLHGTPAILAQGPPGPPMSWPSAHSTPLGADAVLAELEVGFGGEAFGPPMPRLPGVGQGDILIPGAPVPPSPEQDLPQALDLAVGQGGHR